MPELNFENVRYYGLLTILKGTPSVNEAEEKIISLAPGLFFGALIAVAVVAYLLGSLNFAVMISKGKYHDDIRNHGSKNAGTTNMMRTYGRKSAALTFGGDAVKGLVSTAIGGVLLGGIGAAVAGLFCIIGHVYPLYFGFRGGKGVAVAAATVLYIHPVVFLFILLIFVAVVWWTKYLSLGSILATAMYPVLLHSLTPAPMRGIPNVIAVVVACFIIYLHRGNIKRLYEGTENKFKFKKSVAPTAPVSHETEADQEDVQK